MKSIILYRALELIISILGLFIILPFILPTIITVSLLTEQFPFIRQERMVALNKKRIIIYKIRTIRKFNKSYDMNYNSAEIFNNHKLNKFVPSFCKMLRKTGLDETPQLLNVIKGDLSLIGPRPMLERDLMILMREDPKSYKIRTMINSKPGITGFWQIYGDRSKGFKNLVSSDTYYENNKSFLIDLKIFIKTILIMLRAEHSDSIVGNKFREISK